MNAPLLTLDRVVKRFGGQIILDEITLDVRPGEIVCLVGPSGTGKSTLLRCVNGLEAIQGGLIRVDGLEACAHHRDIMQVRRRVGMIFQQFNLYPHLTALQNVMLAPVVVYREDKRTVESRSRALLDRVRLSHRIGAYPAQLSGGEQQRVAIARALATNPKLLMFDEPTSALDPEMRGEVLAVMRLLAQEGRTMLVVTHEMQFAAGVGTRMIFMEHGKIVEDGAPHELLANPQSALARRFLGSVATRLRQDLLAGPDQQTAVCPRGALLR
jgi:ABC-type polar amino acid transport system ATPase subunit